jgi:hypothetical protein
MEVRLAMTDRHPCGTLRRRDFLGAVASVAALPILGGFRHAMAGPVASLPGPLGVPGPFPGRVVEARNPSMIRDGKKDREAIKKSLDRGMKELVGSDDAVQAWRSFFEPGDVVGVKVVPNGYPLAHSSPELMLEVIEGLKAAGVKPADIFVYDRYRTEFMNARMHEAVPDGIKWGGLTPDDDGTQLLIDFPGFRGDPIAGYDRDEFVEMNLVNQGSDPKDDRNVRSHLGTLVTKRLNKIIMLPVLKDHGSAGVTGALKNMSHGSVNNVARSHSTPDSNACNTFIPEVVSHPILRKKCVLQIMDGIRGVFQKGPFGANPEFAWEYNALFLATDPVAMDHVEWRIIDEKRKASGLPPVAGSGLSALDPLGTEGFDVRQPQHIPLAANLGLGIFDFKSPKGRRFSIDHRVLTIA